MGTEPLFKGEGLDDPRALAMIWEHADWGTGEQCGETQRSGQLWTMMRLIPATSSGSSQVFL